VSRRVTILLALHQGEHHIHEQLESFRSQTHHDWELLVSDDGSSDGGPSIVRNFSARTPQRVELFQGPHAGAAANFLSLLKRLDTKKPYVALSDQDDVWLPRKLEVALRWLEGVKSGSPGLYCCRTIICDRNLERPRVSRAISRPPRFGNALVENIAGGNTMVLNAAAAAVARSAAMSSAIPSDHDWWLYQLISGAGGVVLFDDEPHILYRQHAGNEIGAADTWRDSAARLWRQLRSQPAQGCEAMWAALAASSSLLTPENAALLHEVRLAVRQRIHERLRAVRRLGLYRQSLRGALSLRLGFALGRL